MPRLTDRRAVYRALHIAIETEEALIESWMPPSYLPDGPLRDQHLADTKPNRQIHERNIAAFRRVLDRHYGGQRVTIFDELKPVAVEDIKGPQKFRAPRPKRN